MMHSIARFSSSTHSCSSATRQANLFSSWFCIVALPSRIDGNQPLPVFPASQSAARSTDRHALKKKKKRNELSSGSRQAGSSGWLAGSRRACHVRVGASVRCRRTRRTSTCAQGIRSRVTAPAAARQCTPGVIDVPPPPPPWAWARASGRRAPAGQPPVQQPVWPGGCSTWNHHARLSRHYQCINNNNKPI